MDIIGEGVQVLTTAERENRARGEQSFAEKAHSEIRRSMRQQGLRTRRQTSFGGRDCSKDHDCIAPICVVHKWRPNRGNKGGVFALGSEGDAHQNSGIVI